MKVFLTGATGYVGGAVLDALLRGGHSVTALVRDSEKAERMRVREVNPTVGTLGNPRTYRAAAAGCEAVIHTALESSTKTAEIDRTAVDALLDIKPPVFIYTSGIWALGATNSNADEGASTSAPAAISAWRVPHEQRVLDAATDGHRTIVVRPGIVYGGSRGIVGDLLRDAANGLIRVIGSGSNHWPLVYDRDLGDLYVRLMTTNGASGVYHATDGGAETVSEIVAAIREAVPVRPEVRHVPLDEAHTKMGVYADALALDQSVSSPRARALGWVPTLHSVAGNVPRLFEEWRRGRR
ncbi:MAG: NAD(P)H-binding protein [Acidobacteriota bacterium]